MNAKAGLANLITGTRILCSAALLFCPAFSAPFYVLYLMAGLTDMVDGAVARKTGTVSTFGAKLDTVADFSLFAACAVRLFPILDIPLWLWIWIGVIALIKAVNLISGCIIRRKFVSLHTVMNKITGTLLFILPLSLRFLDITYTAPVVCAAATFAAVQEGHYIRTGRDIT